ncbi:PIR Superfamily Protein [Plasmodium ovale wallikeri]|uniref:PIR Superfamily Protein n=1 Tax=Plasmodium ovale wallikeri TaxID=864142 RepID=A0A1A9A606_PLAOA|nr:PIR Superfamily Protein [Plasmodium ovale wallikeri]SBT54076.1 PIR Superfamily Protein [Plasmodium ovale wallikeri]
MEARSTDIELAAIYVFIYFDELCNASFFLNLLFFIKHNKKFCIKKIFILKDLCKRVLKYLEQSTKWEENISEYDDFILLNYWLYDKISRYFVHDKNYIDIAFASLQRIWSNLLNDSYESSYYNKYKPLFNKILNHNDWKKGKEWYYYFVNYELIDPTCTFYDKKFTEYCEYIENKSNIYDNFDKVYATGESYCPHFYKKCKDYNPKVVLNSSKCHDRIKAERYITLEATAIYYPSVQEKDFDACALRSETSDIRTKFGHSFLGESPVLLTASVLYKYTPIGA